MSSITPVASSKTPAAPMNLSLLAAEEEGSRDSGAGSTTTDSISPFVDDVTMSPRYDSVSSMEA